ncbi:MAG: SRPBCC family protein [Acidimicrobiia bacterium]
MADPDDVVTVERVIPAPPEKIFELLADPRRHRMIDGSESVRDPKHAPPRLSLGAKFDMAMKLGFPYTMTNEVIEFEEGRCIAWQPRPAARLARSFGGRIWRYELDPVQGGTRVRETWDISQERWVFVRAGGLAVGAPGFKFMVKPARARAAMAATLERIERLVTHP